jgi:hypothetical protein
MLAFVIPLKRQTLSNSWKNVCLLLERTLKSICNQTTSDFRAIVVCNERPDIAFEHPNLIYFETQIPEPTNDFMGKEKDKIYRCLVGTKHAKSLGASHVMFVDADDCISRRIAEFTNQNSEHNGWFTDKGYEYREDIKLLKIRNKGLHLRTGTSHVVKIALLEPFLDINREDIEYESLLQHRSTARILGEQGTPLEPLPFPGVIYSLDNGENYWSQTKLFWQRKNSIKSIFIFIAGRLNQFLIARPVTKEIQIEFGLYDVLETPN